MRRTALVFAAAVFAAAAVPAFGAPNQPSTSKRQTLNGQSPKPPSPLQQCLKIRKRCGDVCPPGYSACFANCMAAWGC